ncbi:MAG: LysE family transporter [Verrucomicrobiota bacterium]
MEPSVFAKGLLVGFSIAAPVGPIGVLCIRRTLAEGRVSGFVTGLGAATADALYGAVAGFGLTVISSFLLGQEQWLRLAGGVFLVWLGAKTFLAVPAAEAAQIKGATLAGAYASTVFLTLTNPTTILSFVAVFAGFGLSETATNYATAAVFVLGVFLGSALWWLILSGIVGAFRERFGPRQMRWVNRISGAIIMAFGLLALFGMKK